MFGLATIHSGANELYPAIHDGGIQTLCGVHDDESADMYSVMDHDELGYPVIYHDRVRPDQSNLGFCRSPIRTFLLKNHIRFGWWRAYMYLRCAPAAVDHTSLIQLLCYMVIRYWNLGFV